MAISSTAFASTPRADFTKTESKENMILLDSYGSNLTQSEIDKQHMEQIEEHLKETCIDGEEYAISFNYGEIIPYNDPGDYKHESSVPKTASIAGYVGNQPVNGTRFHSTGSGFYYSESGGPTFSVGVSFPYPYNTVSISSSIGNSGTSGRFVGAPDTTYYYKLYASKKYDVKVTISYKRVWVNDFVGYQWKEWSRYTSKVHLTTDLYAVRMN